MIYDSKYFLIIGMGVSGKSAARFLQGRGARVVGMDQKGAAVDGGDGVTVHDEGWAVPWESIDGVVISPGLPATHHVVQAAVAQGKQIFTEIELALLSLPKKQKAVGITGTNGKTTVTLMVTHVLNSVGFPAVALGNIGQPLTSYEGEGREVLVVELSSFQLEREVPRAFSPAFCAGVILNITPNHLDRHKTMAAYATAKLQLAHYLYEEAPLYLHEKAWQEYGTLSPRADVRTFGIGEACYLQIRDNAFYIEGVPEYCLLEEYRGKVCHNVENIAAAYLLCREMDVDPKAFAAAIETYKKPAHRVELIRSLAGVDFYDDSKGTNVEAVLCAVRSMPRDVILIAGGVDKGTGYACWKNHFPGRVKVVLAIGEAALAIREELAGVVAVEVLPSLEDAVRQAHGLARAGDSVLLSPGCASFDMFKNYAHRGEVFQALVHELR